MPQMAPIWWTSFALIFSLLLMIMMTMNYFNFKPKKKHIKKLMNFNMNWKW